MEAEAEAEIRLFQHQKEEKERLEREMVEERERLAREREEMGATWGMGEGRAGQGVTALWPSDTSPCACTGIGMVRCAVMW